MRARRAQAAAEAEIIQRTRPEVPLINEFDYIAGPVTGNALTAAFQALTSATSRRYRGLHSRCATDRGNLRADYVLPSRNLRITGSAVFWPEPGHPLVYLTGTGFPVPSSDHRLVWVDVMVPGSARNQ